MSFGGTSTPDVPKERHPYNLEPARTSSNQAARPVPYLAGTQRLAVTWLGPAYNQRSEPVESSSGGGGKGSPDEDQIVGYDYFADCAGLVCLGPVDALREIWMDRERVWRGSVSRSGDSASITVEDRGALTIYWGTETQTADGLLPGHPAYRGQCYIVFEQLYFGQDKTNAPNVEVVVSRSPLNWPGAPALGTGMIGLDANPIHCMVELLMHPRYGLALPVSYFDQAQIRTTAAALRSAGLGISPLIDSQGSARDWMTRIGEYFDGYLSARNGNVLRIHRKESAAQNPRIYPLIGEYDLTTTPQIEVEPWTDTVNEVLVKFTDRSRRYEDDSEKWVDLANRQIVEAPIAKTLDRAWVTSRAIANRVGAAWGRINSVPLQTARVVIRKGLVDDELLRRGDECEVGSFVRLTYLDYFTTILMRVESKQIRNDAAQTVELRLVNDRYFDAVLDYQPDDVPGVDDTDPDEGLLAVKVIEAHRILRSDDQDADITIPYFAVLAARQYVTDVRLAVWDSESGGSYRRLFRSRQFCKYGTLSAPLGTDPRVSESGSIVLDIPSAAVDRTFPSTTATGWIRGELIAIIDEEIVSYRTAEVISGGSQVRLTGIIRCRFGSQFGSHSAGAPVFVTQRRAILTFGRHTIGVDDSMSFKVVSGSRWSWQSLADVTAQSMTVTGRTQRPLGPANVRAGSNRTGSYFYTTGSGITLTWETRSWLRHGFWYAWDHPYRSQAIQHVVFVRDMDVGGTAIEWSVRVLDAVSISDYDGTSVFTIQPSGGSQTIAGQFGGFPNTLRVRIHARVRGLLSDDFLEITVERASGSQPIPGGGWHCMQPSGLFRLIWSVNPEKLLQDNLTRAAARFSATLPYPTVTGLRAAVAQLRVAANIAALATAAGVTLPAIPLHDWADWVLDDAFERLNAVW